MGPPLTPRRSGRLRRVIAVLALGLVVGAGAAQDGYALRACAHHGVGAMGGAPAAGAPVASAEAPIRSDGGNGTAHVHSPPSDRPSPAADHAHHGDAADPDSGEHGGCSCGTACDSGSAPAAPVASTAAARDRGGDLPAAICPSEGLPPRPEHTLPYPTAPPLHG